MPTAKPGRDVGRSDGRVSRYVGRVDKHAQFDIVDYEEHAAPQARAAAAASAAASAVVSPAAVFLRRRWKRGIWVIVLAISQQFVGKAGRWQRALSAVSLIA